MGQEADLIEALATARRLRGVVAVLQKQIETAAEALTNSKAALELGSMLIVGSDRAALLAARLQIEDWERKNAAVQVDAS